MMSDVLLEFQGQPPPSLLALLMVLIGAVLTGWGVWQLRRGRHTYGPICALAGLLGLVAGVSSWIVPDFLSDGAWMFLLGLEVVLAVAMFYLTVYAYLGTGRLTTLMVLRVLAILTLLLILFQPMVRVTAGEDGNKPPLLILLDRSRSMSVADPPLTVSRYDQAIQTLRNKSKDISAHFRPVWHHFARELETAESLEALAKRKPTETGSDATDIPGAIAGAVRGEAAGMVLISDGQDNSGKLLGKSLEKVREAGVPLYVVGIGSRTEAEAGGGPDLQILSVETPLEVAANNLTEASVKVKVARLAGIPAEVQLYEEGSSQPAGPPQKFQTAKSVDTITVPLRWTPKGSGDPGKSLAAAVRRLHVVLTKNPGAPPAIDANQPDQAEVHVLVSEPRIRVLYVEGSMRPEYKFLKRLLDTDTNIRYTGLIQVQKKRFSAYGNSMGKQLSDLPKTDEDLAQFDVVILGDLEYAALAEQAPLYRRFVVEKGHGLLMIGGKESFGPGGYGGTNFEEILPVLVGPRTQPQETTPFTPQLTAEGEAHPILEGIVGFFPGPQGRKAKEGLPKLPDLLGCVTVVQAKPGATTLAVHPTRRNEAGPLVVLAVQGLGQGRTAAFAADTTWQWFMSMQPLGADSPYQRFWGQMIRWLANPQIKTRDSAPVSLLRMDRTYYQAGEKVKLTARVQDAKGKPSETAKVACMVVSPDANVPVELRPTGDKGVYEGEFGPQRPGLHVVKLSSQDASGQSLGADECSLYIARPSSEMERLSRDEGRLKTIAGKDDFYTDINRLAELIERIIKDKSAPTARPKDDTYRLFAMGSFGEGYEFAGLFILFVVLLTAEWLLRRNWQLH